MKTITIGFSKPIKFKIGSWLIRKYMGTEYSHVYMEFYSDSINRGLIYESVGTGVRFVGAKYWAKHAVEVVRYTIEIKECNYIRIIQECVDHEGDDYGSMQNLGIFLSTAMGLDRNFLTSGMNCSESIGRLLRIEGYKINKDLNLLTPRDIEEILRDGKTHT